MLTPQEVAGRTFARARMGGYNTAMVDELLDQLTVDYTTLYKENAALKAKMKVLADKIEEYRATEDSMRATLLMAQKMASSIVEEAEQKREELLGSAEAEARRKIGGLRQELEEEQRRLTEAKEQTESFLAQVRALFARQMELLDECPSRDARKADTAQPEESSVRVEMQEETSEPAAQPKEEAELPQSQTEEATVTEETAASEDFPPVASPEQEDPFQSSRLRLDDLQFGRNYTSLDDR